MSADGLIMLGFGIGVFVLSMLIACVLLVVGVVVEVCARDTEHRRR